MMQAAQHRSETYPSSRAESMPGLAIERGWASPVWIGDARAHEPVRACAIVVVGPRAQRRSQMLLRHRDRPIAALSANGADQAFAHRIRHRAAQGESQNAQAEVLSRGVQAPGKELISIMRELAIAVLNADRLPELLEYPGRGRVRGHVDMGQPPRAVLDDHVATRSASAVRCCGSVPRLTSQC